MEDKEIVKALECCGIGEDFKVCDDCPCCIEGEKAIDCVKRLHKATLDLINRLQAENGIYETCNARKDEAIKHLESEVKRLQAENERLKPFEDKIAKFNSHIRVEDMLVFASSLEEWLEFCENLKAEAYKEVFEKLNEKADVRKVKMLGGLHIVKVVTLHDINALKKELVGEDDG